MFDYKKYLISTIEESCKNKDNKIFTIKELRKTVGIGGVATLLQMHVLKQINVELFEYIGEENV